MQRLHGRYTLHCNISGRIYTVRVTDIPTRSMERQMTLISNSGEVYGAKALTWAMIAVSGFLFFASFHSPAQQVTANSASGETVIVTVPYERLS